MIVLAYFPCSLLLFYIIDILLCLIPTGKKNLFKSEDLKIVIFILCFIGVLIVFIKSEKTRNIALDNLYIVFKDFCNYVINNNYDKTYDIIFLVLVIALIIARIICPKNILAKESIISVVELSIPLTFLFLSIFSLTYFKSFNKYFLIFGLTSIPLIIRHKNINIIAWALFYSLLSAMILMISVVVAYIITIIISIIIGRFLQPLFDNSGNSFSDSWGNDNKKDDSSENSSKSNWYDRRAIVRDDDGNKYKVGRSGDYIEDSSGEWKRVYRDSDGEPYIYDGSDKTWLK